MAHIFTLEKLKDVHVAAIKGLQGCIWGLGGRKPIVWGLSVRYRSLGYYQKEYGNSEKSHTQRSRVITCVKVQIPCANRANARGDEGDPFSEFVL